MSNAAFSSNPLQVLSNLLASAGRYPHAPQSLPGAGRLKVRRVFEMGTHPACAGRMVISGRMADVCAELNRMC